MAGVRRARERRQREELILDCAALALRSSGYLGLNLDKLAEQVGYAKGTLYQHFETKEDIVLGVAVRHMTERAALFGRAVQFRGRSRERAMAIAMADLAMGQLFPGHHEIDQLARMPSMWEKTAEARREQLGRAECRCLDAVSEVVHGASRDGDLQLLGHSAEQLAFNIWAMAHGTNLLLGTSAWLRRAGVAPVIRPGRTQSAFLDALGWKPLSTDWDFDATTERIRAEVFPELHA
jgi:AcrR family transcriptional regulator